MVALWQADLGAARQSYIYLKIYVSLLVLRTFRKGIEKAWRYVRIATLLTSLPLHPFPNSRQIFWSLLYVICVCH